VFSHAVGVLRTDRPESAVDVELKALARRILSLV